MGQNERYKVIGTPVSKQPDWMPRIEVDNKPTDLKTKIMQFDKPVFHEGLNTTIRLGDKWYNFLDVGGWFKPKGNDGFARVRELQLRKFSQCRDRHILATEHDPNCRDFVGLRQALCNAYPEFASAGKLEQDKCQVTAVGFILYKPSL